MKFTLESAEQVTPAWLTDVLRQQGLLTQGEVANILPGKVQRTFGSCVWRLEVSYSQQVPSSAPKKLFLKTSNPAMAPGEFDSAHLANEISFYSEIAPVMSGTITVPCYSAAYEPETGACHILLKDVSDTHVPCPMPLSLLNCEQAVDSLAHLHAFWWDHPRLGVDIGQFPSQEERQQDWIGTEQATTEFIKALRDQISPLYRKVYERVLPALPNLFKRHATGRNLTLVHGDAHVGNYLFPKDPTEGHTYLIDWQFWHPTIGGTDLAFMMATEWEPEIRRSWERALLQHYYRSLLGCGVQGYSWDNCWDDYRLSVILVSIFIPVWRWAVFKWKPDMIALERSMTAFFELKCDELL